MSEKLTSVHAPDVGHVQPPIVVARRVLPACSLAAPGCELQAERTIATAAVAAAAQRIVREAAMPPGSASDVPPLTPSLSWRAVAARGRARADSRASRAGAKAALQAAGSSLSTARVSFSTDRVSLSTGCVPRSTDG